MNELVNIAETKIAKQITRADIMDFENVLKTHPGAVIGDNPDMPLKHSFADGIYVREIFLPAGSILTGKIHKHEHPNFLMSGKVRMVTEFGDAETVEGPKAMISRPGTKRTLYIIEDTVWITVHLNPTNTQNLDELEDYIIAKNYEEYDKYTSKQARLTLFKKVLNILDSCFRRNDKRGGVK